MAKVWSKKAREAIKEHDKSCLGKPKPEAKAEGGEQKKKKKTKTRQYREKKI